MSTASPVIYISIGKPLGPAWCPRCLNRAWYADFDRDADPDHQGAHFCLACDRWVARCTCADCLKFLASLEAPSVRLRGEWAFCGDASDAAAR